MCLHTYGQSQIFKKLKRSPQVRRDDQTSTTKPTTPNISRKDGKTEPIHIDPSKLPKNATIIPVSNAIMKSNLAHLAVNVSIDGHIAESVQFMALNDTGSEKTIMSKAAFDRVCKAHKDANVTKHTKNTNVQKLEDCYIQAYDGSLTEAYGTFELTLHFMGVNGITKKYKILSLIHI